MDKKKIIEIVLKVCIYALGLILTALGVSAVTACSTSHSVQSSGVARVVTIDTTFVKHGGFIRSKNYMRYE